MALMRNSTLKQLQRINSEIKKQGGETDKASPSEKGLPNSLWISDPIDSHKSGKRHISTYEDTWSTDIPDPTESELKMKNENMKIKKFDQLFENGPNDTPIEIMRNMKTIKNWTNDVPNAKRPMVPLNFGRYIESAKVRGYISRIEGNDVYVSSIDEPTKLVKITLKEAIKGYKPEKEKVVKLDMSIAGPNNKTLATAPKEGDNPVSPKLDQKSDKTKDQKISNKIYTDGVVKFSDMASDFDKTTIGTKSSQVASELNLKSNVAKDNAITVANYSDKKDKLGNLAKDFDSTVTKGKNKPIQSNLDGKSKTVADNEITTKNTRLKSFKELTDMSQPLKK